MKLANNLYIHRKQAGLSQEEVAEKCLVSRQAAAKWESGESVPTIDKLISLADLYQITLDELVGRQNNIAQFRELVKQISSSNISSMLENDLLPVICRFLGFLDKYNLSDEDKLCGILEVFGYDNTKD